MTEDKLKQAIHHAIEQATVKIFLKSIFMGTGFFITSDGYVLTAFHCIGAKADIEEGFVGRVKIELGSGKILEAQLDYAKSVPDNDIAVLKVNYSPEYYLPLGIESNVYDEVVALGYPVGRRYGTIGTYPGKISRFPTDNQIETDAVKGTGHSGSALYHYASKRVIGIVSEVYKPEEMPDSGFAVQLMSLFKTWPELQTITAEVAKNWEDHPAVAALSYRRIPSNIPFSGAKEFVGRELELKTLHQQFQTTSRLVISAIAGMGGIGKTELAIQYALLHKSDYLGGICWLPASAQDLDLGIQLTDFSKFHLNVSFPDDLKKIEDKVAFCWQQWPAGDVLIVLDNVTHFEDVKPYLPPLGESRFKLLITTRQQMGQPIQQLELDIFDEVAALALLEAHIGKDRLQQELAVAKKLCAWLGYLPLGLELVGRYLAIKEDLSLAQMQERLEKKRLQQAALVEPTPEMTAQRGVAAAFELSWEELDKQARQLGCLLSLFAPAPIRWELVEQLVRSSHSNETENQEGKLNSIRRLSSFFRKCFSKVIFRKTIPLILSQNIEELEKIRDQQLRKLHLLSRKEQNIYQLHPLVGEFLRMKLAKSGWDHHFKQAFAELMANVARVIHDFENIREYQAIADTIPHLEEVATHLTDFLGNNDLVWPCTGLGNFYEDGQLDYRTAEFWYKRSLLLTQTRLGDHLNTADSLHNLGLLYKKEVVANYSEAESLFLQEIELGKRLGNSHIFIRSVFKLTHVYFSEDHIHEYESINIELLKFIKEIVRKEYNDNFSNIPLLEDLILHFEHLRETKPVLPIIFDVHQFQPAEKTFDSLLDDIASIIVNLATLHALQGRFVGTEALFQQAFEIWKLLGKDNSSSFLTSLSNLAGLYKEQGRYDEAESLLLQNLELRKKIQGEEDYDIARDFEHLATYVYMPQQRYEEAEEVLLKAENILLQSLELKKQIVGDKYIIHSMDGFMLASILSVLTELYFTQGQYDKSEIPYKKLLEIANGEVNDKVALVQNTYGVACYKQKKYAEAESLYWQAKAIWEKLFGPEYKNVALCLHNLSAVYDEQNNLEKAVSFCHQAQAIWEKTIGTEDPLYARSLDRLVGIYKRQGKCEEAKSLYERALTIRETKLGINHPDTVSTRQNLEKLLVESA